MSGMLDDDVLPISRKMSHDRPSGSRFHRVQNSAVRLVRQNRVEIRRLKSGGPARLLQDPGHLSNSLRKDAPAFHPHELAVAGDRHEQRLTRLGL